ncbi:MAG: hypothetical protein ACPL88_03555, partial [Bryobacteraceae bacterium]
LAALEQLEWRRASRGDHYKQMAFVYAGLGEHGWGLDALRKVSERREGESLFAGVEPFFDALRLDPTFAALLKTPPTER